MINGVYMGKLWDKLQPAVKKETRNVFLYSLIGTVVMWIGFFVLHLIMPEDVSFDAYVFIGGIGGMLVATLNFFIMALTVQKVASEEDDKKARSIMKTSYSRRMLMQIAWIIVALCVPFINWVAGILPLLFPGLGIKIKGILNQKKYNKEQEVDVKQNGD